MLAVSPALILECLLLTTSVETDSGILPQITHLTSDELVVGGVKKTIKLPKQAPRLGDEAAHHLSSYVESA